MIYTAGLDALPQNSQTEVIDTLHIDAGEQILKYQVPVISFKFISPAILQAAIEKWIAIKNAVAGPGEQVTDITGVYINDTTGEVDFRVNVTYIPMATLPDGTPIQIQEAGVDYIKVLYVVGAVAAVLGIALTLVAVYRIIDSVVPAGAAPLTFGLLFGLFLGGLLVAWLLTKFTLPRGAPA